MSSVFVPHNEMPPMDASNTPVNVTYCGFCGFPTDFCKYGPLADKHAATTTNTVENSVTDTVKPAPAPATTTTASLINVKIAPRVGRRYLTTISGLSSYDIDLAKAVKIFSKKFACGVCKTDNGDIEIQGDCEENIVEVITSNWKQVKAKYISIKKKDSK